MEYWDERNGGCETFGEYELRTISQEECSDYGIRTFLLIHGVSYVTNMYPNCTY